MVLDSARHDSPRPGDELKHIIVNIGDADAGHGRWWAAVLAEETGWTASIRNNKGGILYSPWSIKVHTDTPFAIISSQISSISEPNYSATSSQTALRYLSEYCHLHDIYDQAEAALAAALFIPVANLDGMRIKLPLPQLALLALPRQLEPRHPPLEDSLQWLDRLLTLSCNTPGLKALLSSVFFDPGIECNVCGAWLQGSFAFLDGPYRAKERHLLLRTLIKRDPGLDFLWLGAFMTGTEARCIRDARAGWWKVDLSSAAWTGTHTSFIQSTIPEQSADANIPRADEARLMYLAHGSDHTTPPLFPFAPFGFTAIEDTDLDVRQHAKCSAQHGLVYSGFTWDCEGGREIFQPAASPPGHIRMKPEGGLSINARTANTTVDYEDLDLEDEVSEMVTRNIFTWLRGEAGFPVAERAIREHEWIDNLDSDDDSPIEGDVRSTIGNSLGTRRWMMNMSTWRSNSM